MICLPPDSLRLLFCFWLLYLASKQCFVSLNFTVVQRRFSHIDFARRMAKTGFRLPLPLTEVNWRSLLNPQSFYQSCMQEFCCAFSKCTKRGRCNSSLWHSTGNNPKTCGYTAHVVQENRTTSLWKMFCCSELVYSPSYSCISQTVVDDFAIRLRFIWVWRNPWSSSSCIEQNNVCSHKNIPC